MSNRALTRLLVLIVCLNNACHSRTAKSQSPGDLFTDVTAQSKIQFTQNPGVDGTYFMPESIGSGAALFDYNNDGRLDVYLVQPGSHHKQDETSKDRLFQQQPDGTFLDLTSKSGLGDLGYGTGVAAGDIDNDGDLDLYVANFEHDSLYRNNGNGTFTNITKQAGIESSGWSSSVAFLDYDLDGFLDIYVVKYLDYNPAVHCADKAGRPEYCGPKGFSGTPDILYHNNHDGRFTDVSVQSGVASRALKGLGVVTADFNNDGYPDIYVANDGEPNLLWINQKNGTFRDEATSLGAAVNSLGQPEAGMGVAAGDIDADGDLDLFLTHLSAEKNTLYRNLGSLGFQDDSWASGLAGPSIPFTGFGTGLFDFDNDGDLDIAVVNGRIARGNLPVHSATPSYWDPYSEPNFLFANDGGGHFQNVSNRAGSFCSTIQASRGLAFGDIDNDGDIDLLVTAEGAPARLYRNNTDGKAHWLLIRAIDPALHRDMIGAKITVNVRGKKIFRVVNPAYSYLCSNDPRIHFGLGSAISYDSIEIEWPGGSKERFPGGRSDQVLILRKGDGK